MLTFDIETNSIDFNRPDPYRTATTVHCLVIADARGQVTRYNDQPDTEHSINLGLVALSEAPDIGGHNVQGFDIPVLRHLYGFKPKGRVWDSLVLSQMHYGSDLLWRDSKRRAAGRSAPPPRLTGRHSLEAWGHRLGTYKDDYKARCTEGQLGPELQADPFCRWTPELEDYCEQDTLVNMRLFGLLRDRGILDTKAARMECDLAPHLARITEHGWAFDERAAAALQAELSGERETLRQGLVESFGSFYVPDGAPFTPKRNNRTLGYVEGATVQKLRLVEFNPGSDEHVAQMLIRRHGWKPTAHTDKGHIQATEAVLKGLDYPEVPALLRHMLLNKRLSQLAEGKKAWLRVVRDGRIHGGYMQNGTRTGRMSHVNPNIAQVPKVGKPYGAECRSLFTASPGYVMVGGDASGIELRLLAHFTHKYDGGALAEVILRGDVHTENLNAVGMKQRDYAKTFMYALLYGAGDEKLGRIMAADVNEGWSKKRCVTEGKAARARIMARFPGFGILSKRVRAIAKKGSMPGIDGRVMTGVSQHDALNTLLQGTAGVLMKAAVLRLVDALEARGMELWVDAFILGHIHDEIQTECRPEMAELVGGCIVSAIRKTGDDYGIRIPLDGEFKIGPTWAATH